jgi:hypothetical protein
MNIEIIEKLNDIIKQLKEPLNMQQLPYPLRCYKCENILNLRQCIYYYCPNIICQNCTKIIDNKSFCDKHK